ncbi:MAG: hypothetical protein JKY00_06990 [Roseicyclus sp.]|nr:hypothetical protein [Roseicyclus sp.]
MRFLRRSIVSGPGFFALTLALLFASVTDGTADPRRFATSFEHVDEFAGFYIVPQNYMGSASHDLSDDRVHSGRFAHRAWVTQANPSIRFRNTNHRAYPTIQLYTLEGGAFRTPVEVIFWVWLDMEIEEGEWFSLATLDHTTSDRWDPVLVNLSDEGFVHLMHTPTNGRGERSFQTDSIRFPQRQWVELSILLHFDRRAGYAEVRQDGQLVSAAPVRRGNGFLTQAHFGMYAPPTITNGVVYNDDLVIVEAAVEQ